MFENLRAFWATISYLFLIGLIETVEEVKPICLFGQEEALLNVASVLEMNFPP